MKNLIFVIAVVIVYRFVFSLSGLIRTIHYQKIYESYLKGACNDFAVHTAPVKKLFQQAKVSDIVLPYTDFVGGGHFRVTNVSVFENMANTREDTVSAMQNCFSKAKGTFRMNILECLSRSTGYNWWLFFQASCASISVCLKRSLHQRFFNCSTGY